MADMHGRVALVTGGGRGLGRAIALELGRRGADVVVADIFVDQQGTAAADAVVAEITSAGGRAAASRGDVSSFDGADGIVRDAVEAFGRLDVLVTCAGNASLRNILDLDEAEWDSILRVHLTGHAGCIKAAGEQMIKQGDGGRIVTVASRGSFFSSGAAYAAAKAGIMGLTASMAFFYRQHGISVNCVLPSAVTQLFPSDASTRTLGGTPESLDMDPQAVAPTVVYLCGPDAADVTGRYVYVSGGDITLFHHPLLLQDSTLFIRRTDRWTVEDLEEALPPLLGIGEHRWSVAGMPVQA